MATTQLALVCATVLAIAWVAARHAAATTAARAQAHREAAMHERGTMVPVAELAAATAALTSAAASLEPPTEVHAIDRYIGHRVVMHVRRGSSVRGILAAAERDAFVLRQAEHLAPNGAPVPLDGEQIIQRGDLDYFQALPAAEAAEG